MGDEKRQDISPGNRSLYPRLRARAARWNRRARAFDRVDAQTLSDTRTHGWERSHEGWSGGRLCGPGTIGHTGFTGTGLWIDFDKGKAWTLLTNRIHPTRHFNSGIATLRQAVGDLVNGA